MLARDPEALFNDRKRLYEACAHYRVDASGSSGKIADAISGFI